MPEGLSGIIIFAAKIALTALSIPSSLTAAKAEKSFKAFIGEHPKDALTSNAYYWLGETYYVQKKFQLAAISFARGFQNFPKGNKAIDQLFKLALTFMNLGKNEDACAAFSKLEAEFPDAPKRISNRSKDYIKRAKC